MLQLGETEKWCDGRTSRRYMGCAITHLDFSDGFFEVLGIGVSRQILMRPGVRADRHPGIDELFSDLGMPARKLADFKKRCLETFVLKRLQHSYGAHRAGPIVEGQNDFPVAEEIVSSEML
jgi:hypothetical protein